MNEVLIWLFFKLFYQFQKERCTKNQIGWLIHKLNVFRLNFYARANVISLVLMSAFIDFG